MSRVRSCNFCQSAQPSLSIASCRQVCCKRRRRHAMGHADGMFPRCGCTDAGAVDGCDDLLVFMITATSFALSFTLSLCFVVAQLCHVYTASTQCFLAALVTLVGPRSACCGASSMTCSHSRPAIPDGNQLANASPLACLFHALIHFLISRPPNGVSFEIIHQTSTSGAGGEFLDKPSTPFACWSAGIRELKIL